MCARLASEAKAGYYPTPEDEMALVLRALRMKDVEKPCFVYDPCCGEGAALSMLVGEMQKKGAKHIRSYGSEIEEERAEEARAVLDEVILDGYQNIRTESKFSLLWLNPPYQDGLSERVEVEFLKKLTGKKSVLQKGGVLLFCIPQYVLVKAAETLSDRFTNLDVYRFTDANYDIFKQVVVIGRLGRAKYAMREKYKEILKLIGNGDKDIVPTLEEDWEFEVPGAESDELPLFRAGYFDKGELNKDLASSSLMVELQNRIVPKRNAVEMKRPMLELKPAHMAIAIAAGAVGGNMGSHVITGVTQPKKDTESLYDDDGNYLGVRNTYHYVSVVRGYTPEGVFTLE
jgi:16S rRNA G966 N2-methylase RsmD